MTRAEAIRILGGLYCESDDYCDDHGTWGLLSAEWEVHWEPGEIAVDLKGCFTADQLEAMATIVRTTPSVPSDVPTG